jgi:hypothetical protein
LNKEQVFMKKFVPALLLAIAAALVACSGGAIPQPPLVNIAGAWELKAASSNSGADVTGIEVALKVGQTLVNGVEQANGQVTATGATQISILTINAANGSVVFGGNCALSGSGTYSLTGSYAALGGPFNFNYTENGNVFNVTATLGGDGQSLTGTYTSATGSACSDSGTITGAVVPKLSGTYVGQLTLPDSTNDSVTATFSEDSTSTLTLNLVATGPDNTNFTMTGPVTGNAFLVQGTFQGNPVSYEGYYELTAALLPEVYFVNATNTAQPAYAGTLTPQPPTN